VHGFAQIGAGRVQQGGHILQAVVHCLHGIEPRAHVAELTGYCRFAFIQPLNQRLAAFDQGGDMCQPRMFG